MRAGRRGFVLCKGRSMLGAFPLGVEPGISLPAGEVTQGELLAGSLGELGWGMQWKWGIRRWWSWSGWRIGGIQVAAFRRVFLGRSIAHSKGGCCWFGEEVLLRLAFAWPRGLRGLAMP